MDGGRVKSFAPSHLASSKAIKTMPLKLWLTDIKAHNLSIRNFMVKQRVRGIPGKSSHHNASVIPKGYLLLFNQFFSSPVLAGFKCP